MATQKNIGWDAHKGKMMMTTGLILLLIGALRFYRVEWPVVLMVIGVVLIIKGAMKKYQKW